jgi:hypothetical protein
VTVFPPRPFFSSRSLATMRAGSGSWEAVFRLHMQERCGQPQVAHFPPVAVE